MIATLRPSPATKDSGIQWLGEVPEHWEEKRAKYLYREVDERSTTGREELMSVSHKTGVTPRKENVTMFMAESNVGHKICRPEDLVINTMWASMAALGVARQVGVVSPSYGVYRPLRSGDLHPEYVDRLLRIEDYKSGYLCRSFGIRSSRLRPYPDQFLRIPMLSPPLEEQITIVRILDHLDRRIRRYIRAKQKLIGLLEEQKPALLHRAVTRGLPSTGSGQAPPNVPLRPSGIDWLGDIPEHWDVVSLRSLCASILDGPHVSPAYQDDGVLFISARNVKQDSRQFGDAKYISWRDYELSSRRMRPERGDVLYTKGGTTGALARWTSTSRFKCGCILQFSSRRGTWSAPLTWRMHSTARGVLSSRNC